MSQHSVSEMDYYDASELLEACGKGELEAVKVIVGGLEVDVDESATYYYQSVGPSAEATEIKGASPLFVAAGNCNLAIVHYLIRKGAYINCRTPEDSGEYAGMSPLHAAVCLRQDVNWFQKRAMIELLISNGADAFAVTPDGFSMWMLCCKENVARHLLVDLGLSLMQQFPGKNCAALHHFASSQSYDNPFDEDAVRINALFLTKGADLKARDVHGLTPLNVAAIGSRNGLQECPNVPVLRYLVGREEVSLSEKIDALELAGAMIILRTQNDQSTSQALKYWDIALHVSKAQGSIPKVPLKSKTNVHWRAKEWTTQEELVELQNRPLADLKMQAALVARRIFSSISSKALVFFLWNGFFFNQHSLALLVDNQHTKLLEMCWIILEGARQHYPYDEDLWVVIVQTTFLLVHCLKELKSEQSPFLNLETMKLSLELVFVTNNWSPSLPALCIPRSSRGSWTKPMRTIYDLVAILSNIRGDMVTHEIKCMLHQFVKLDSRDGFDGCNLLLAACDRKPNAGTLATVRLFLEVGADPNVKDISGNSPLHHVAEWMEEGESDSPTADLLLKHRAHLDQANDFLQTPLDVWKMKHEIPERVLSPPAWMNPVLPLTCWSARSIQRTNRIPRSQVPENYRDFVSMH